MCEFECVISMTFASFITILKNSTKQECTKAERTPSSTPPSQREKNIHNNTTNHQKKIQFAILACYLCLPLFTDEQ